MKTAGWKLDNLQVLLYMTNHEPDRSPDQSFKEKSLATVCRMKTRGASFRNAILTFGFLLFSSLSRTQIASAGSSVIGWGDAASGGLNIPGDLTNATAIAACDWRAMALKSDGTVVGWGNGWSPPPPGLSNVVAISAGRDHSLALKKDGTVVGWGSNQDPLGYYVGQATVPPGLSGVVGIAAGAYHSLALKADGTVVGWGMGGNGQASPPAGLSNVVAMAAGDWHSLALKRDGTVAAWGSVVVPPGLSNVVAVAAAGRSMALTVDGTVIEWASSGEMPVGLSNVVAISVGGLHSIALKDDGTIVAWGSGDVAPSSVSNAVAIASGFSFDLALLRDLPSIVRQPLDEVVYSGMPVVFSLGAVGSSQLAYQWQFDGSNIVEATRAWLKLTNVQPADAGAYSVVISNWQGVVISSNAMLQVLTSPPIVKNLSPNQFLDVGSNALLYVTAEGSWPLSYQWQFNGNAISGATNSSLNLASLQSLDGGLYTTVISNSFGSVVSSGTLVTVKDLPSALNAPELPWTTSGNTIWFFQTNTTHDGLAAAQSGALAAINQPSLLQTSVNGPGKLSFWCALNSYWGEEFLGFSIDGVQQFYLPIYSTGWQQKTFYLPPGSHTLEWSFYTPFYADSRDAAWVDQVLYVPGPTPPTITTSPSNLVVSAGAGASFVAVAVGTPPMTYQWRFNGAELVGATNTILSLTNVQAGHAGDYVLAISNAYGGTNVLATLVVSPVAPTITAQPVGRRVTVGAASTFFVRAIGSLPFSYQWMFNSNQLNAATNATLALSDLQISDSGTYQCAVSNAFGLVISSNALLTVSPTLVVGWGYARPQTNVPPDLTNAIAIAAGALHNVCLQTNGGVVAWGDNYYGQLNVPLGLTNVIATACGQFHNLALREDHTVVAWGAGTNIRLSPHYGQSCVPVGLSNVVQIAAGGFHSLALKADRTVIAWGAGTNYSASPHYGQSRIPAGLSQVQSVAAGGYHSLAIQSNATVLAWGNNGYGQTNVPSGLSNVVAVAAGQYHSLALCSDGSVVAWGDRYFGQANVPTGLSNVVGIAAGGYHSLAWKSDGTMVAWGAGTNYSYEPRLGQSIVPAGLSNAVAMAGGRYHTLALLNDGSPFVLRQPLDQEVIAGSDVLLSAVAVGRPFLNFQWQFNGSNIAGATTGALVLTNIPLSSAGNYQCVVGNSLGFATSLPAFLRVLRPIPRFDSAPEHVQLADTGFNLRLLGLSGHGDVVLYASTNLLDWQAILTNAPVLGSLQFSDSEATNLPFRFYRAEER